MSLYHYVLAVEKPPTPLNGTNGYAPDTAHLAEVFQPQIAESRLDAQEATMPGKKKKHMCDVWIDHDDNRRYIIHRILFYVNL